MRIRALTFVAVLFFLVVYAVPNVHGQRVSGSITGYVYDPSDAPVVGATVTVTNTDTGVVGTRTTEATGLYLFTNLNPGSYSVAVEAAGFRRYVQENVVLRVDSTVRADVHLVIGELTQEVSVTGESPILKPRKRTWALRSLSATWKRCQRWAATSVSSTTLFLA
jgi:hypothetical protein